MRRALRLLLVAALVAALCASATGVHAFRILSESATEAVALEALDGAPALVHAILGHLTVALVGVVAAMAFILGLQGLLDAGGRRALSALLFVLAPTMTWLAFGAEFFGGLDAELVRSGLLSSELERVVHDHGLLHGGGLVAALLATAGLARRLSSAPTEQAG